MINTYGTPHYATASGLLLHHTVLFTLTPAEHVRNLPVLVFWFAAVYELAGRDTSVSENHTAPAFRDKNGGSVSLPDSGMYLQVHSALHPKGPTQKTAPP
jgi:hypothetical protein